MKHIALIFALLMAFTPAFGRGRSGGYSGHHSYSSHSYTRSRIQHSRTSPRRTYHRSRAARNAFQSTHPRPSTGRNYGACPGYVVDHVQPLACGGADAPSNMQWETVSEGKAKDKWERKGCR
jgi:hypothetical protein